MGTSMLGKKYTAEYKIEKVKEYLSKIENGEKISKADFAYQNGLCDCTFNDWVIKFQKLGKGFANVTEQITILANNAVEQIPKVVQYDGVVQGELPKDMVKVIFNGIFVEFNKTMTEKVLEFLRRW